MVRWLLSFTLLSVVLWAMALPQARSQDDEGEFSEDEAEYSEDEIEGPTLPWRGESPFWVYGQEFSAVADAPFIGSSECLYCHEELKAGFLRTAHARSFNDNQLAHSRQGCEACHGAGGAHAVLRSRGAIFAFDWSEPEKETRICLRCHEWLSTMEEWQKLTHAKAGIRCTTCHDPHVAQTQRLRFLLVGDPDSMCASCHADVAHDFTRFSRHPIVIDPANEPGARAMHCTDCHNVHAGKGPRMLAERRISDLCLRCHLDKGGPYRYVHMAVEEGIGQGCLLCHKPHGSDMPWLTPIEGRELCTQCHTDREEHNPGLTCYTTGCHVGLHGSNKSPLFLE